MPTSDSEVELDAYLGWMLSEDDGGPRVVAMRTTKEE